jgi:hypothetical protein
MGIYGDENPEELPQPDTCDECKAMEAWFKCECGRSLCAECYYYTCDCGE